MDRSKSDVELLLDELAPGEKREHVRSVAPSGAEGRFWVVAQNGDTFGSVQWVNDDTRPSYLPQFPIIEMADLPTPILQVDLRESALGDFYRVSPHLYVFRSTIVDCIRELDANAIEFRRAEARGVGKGLEFCLVMIRREMDAIDINKTNLTLHYKKILPDREIYGKRVYYHPTGFCLRDDIPSNVHCFVEPYGAMLLLSNELMARLAATGVRGLHARHPTAGETGVTGMYL